MTSNLVRKIVLITAPLSLLALSACATPFRADVSRFQQLPPAQGQSFAIMAADPKDVGGIEFGQYAGLVASRMQALGYTPAAPGAKADLNVLFDYGVDAGKERRVVTRDPFYDPYWGFGHSGFYRPIPVQTRYGIRFVSGYYDPFLFGGLGYGGGYDVDSFTVYTSGIDLKIKRAVDGQNVFEGKAEAKSRSNKLAYLVPNLVEAMFTGFPGNSGETVRISVAPEGK
jgi:Domain of unknown function (DUF4136)